MGSTMRQHWTSMFKAKHTCNHYCQKDVAPSISPTPPCPHRRPPSTSAAPKDRTREPKPRWSPKPEQICILQSIFDSGMINPPREEIRKIRAQLQEYGEVGEANVFYWFQNRKSRIKYKKRLEKASSSTAAMPFVSPSMTPFSVAPTTVEITRGHQQPHGPLIPAGEPGEFFLPHLTPCANVDPHQMVGDNFGFLGNDVIMRTSQKDVPSSKVSNVGQQYNYPPLFSANGVVDDELFNSSVVMPSANNLFNINRADNVITAANCISSPPSPTKVLGSDESAPATMRSTVFINDVPVEVGLAPVNVREIFGDDAMLIDSSGNPVVTDDMGFSLQPLQDCAFYYLVHLSAPFS